MEVAKDIFWNIVSDAIFIFFGISAGILFYRVCNRNKLLGFFGLKKSRRIIIYQSNIKVIQRGSQGIDGVIRSYDGSTIPFGEAEAAKKIEMLFSFLLPSLTEKPGLLSNLLIADVLVQTTTSPNSISDIDHEVSFITLGSPAYNAASKFAESLNSVVRYQLGTIIIDDGKAEEHPKEVRPTSYSTDTEIHIFRRGISAPTQEARGTADTYNSEMTNLDIQNAAISKSKSISSSGTAYKAESDEINKSEPSAIVVDNVSPFTDPSFAFVQRIIDKGQGREIFYVAGLSEVATQGAAYYLTTEWMNLQKENKDGTPFLVMLKIDINNYKNYSRVFVRK